MSITQDKVVTIHYTLTNQDGEELDSSKGQDPLAYLHGHNNIIPGLEKELEGKAKGDKLDVTIQPEDAYGKKDPAKVEKVALTEFETPEDVTVGAQFHVQGVDGLLIATVVEKTDTHATMDMNHPLADETLNFKVEVVDIRDASKEELEHGHAHGEGGHQH